MSARIPEIIDPFFLADKHRMYEGEILLSDFARLGEKITNLDDRVVFRLNFSKIGKLSTIDGFVRAKICLECQNCLQPVDVGVDSDVKLAIVHSDEEAGLITEDYEPLLCNEEKINFTDIIEDEILLSLPAIPKHEHDCFARQEAELEIEENGQSEQDSPFSVLATIKKLELK